jgi:hypothetical protein
MTDLQKIADSYRKFCESVGVKPNPEFYEDYSFSTHSFVHGGQVGTPRLKKYDMDKPTPEVDSDTDEDGNEEEPVPEVQVPTFAALAETEDVEAIVTSELESCGEDPEPTDC